MPSAASATLKEVLNDVRDLNGAHKSLRSGNRGRVWGLGGLNRAAAVLSIAGLEAYIEDVIIEVVDALRPSVAAGGTWPALSAFARKEVERFNTPSPSKIDWLFQQTLGLPNLSANWHWQRCTPTQAKDNLDFLIKLRHEAAHGVMPRPVVQNKTAEWAPLLVARIARCTDDAIKTYAATSLAVQLPW